MRVISNVFVGLSCAGLLAIAFPSHAKADGFDKEEFLTFSAPVALPGVALPAGTYEFRLADPEGDRNVVQVLSQDGMTVYGTFLTIPDSQWRASDRSTVRFEQATPRAPEAIKSWFYPGDQVGREFIYPERPR